jgi:DNA-3-methyladenine glycosylase I
MSTESDSVNWASRPRCSWSRGDALMVSYHDQEWGVPVRDDRALFAKLTLDSFQAGLSWATVLRKRKNFLRAFHGFDPARLVRYNQRSVERLMTDVGIIRNRAKIEAAIGNARAWMTLMDQGPGFSEFLWAYVGGETLVNRWASQEQLPASTAESTAMCSGLRDRGFRFVGPTICYAFMQAVGMVNDHVVGCYRHAELSRES